MKNRIISIFVAAWTLLCSFSPAQAQSQENLVDRVSKAVEVTLPDGYQGKVKEYVNSSKVLEGSGGEFTEQFIKGQMKENWGINKQNQLLFIWDAIYEQVTKKNFYDGEDGNKQRLDDFENALDNVEACGKKYKQGYMEYMQRRSEEADRRIEEAERGIEEADRRIEEAERRSEEALTNSLSNLVWFYNRYHNNNLPSIPTEERKQWEEKARLVFEGCKELNLDHKAILRKELGDEKKVNELLKFYRIE